ncbi:MAG: chorismate mutase [Candidatus Melainabacteria bacterium RIFCSPHIGHO2_02_FULL_34_12]|nr:MAG: chorismate mutase [Candidatus Melainabacteria bacterium RIFCSPHIGHO2_02_FULL_34_12]
MEKLASIRGAITVKENSIKEIKNSTTLLLTELLKQNKLDKSKIINIIFTVTDDINELNPATVSREEFQLDSVPILCVQEMKIKNGLPKCIRVLIQTYTELKKEEIKHVYLGGAENLRPDISRGVS